MFRKFISALEDWIFNDDSVLIGMGKLLLVILILTGLMLIPIAYIKSKDPKIVLDETEWSCTHTRTIIVDVLVGKIIVPQPREVCDVYKMNREE